jgi:hypothetical protein
LPDAVNTHPAEVRGKILLVKHYVKERSNNEREIVVKLQITSTRTRRRASGRTGTTW